MHASCCRGALTIMSDRTCASLGRERRRVLPDLFRTLRSTEKKMRVVLRGPRERFFRQQVWVNPFWEDDSSGSVMARSRAFG